VDELDAITGDLKLLYAVNSLPVAVHSCPSFPQQVMAIGPTPVDELDTTTDNLKVS
jgi:peptidyl-tRNA hydrolase